MSGAKMTTQRKTILAAVKKPPSGGDYAWDGKDEEERPFTREEMLKGVDLNSTLISSLGKLTLNRL